MQSQSETPCLELEVLDSDRIDEIAPLWSQLNAHHHAQAPLFRAVYAQNRWQQRRDELLAKANHGNLLILVVRDARNALVAYCIASVSVQGVGELDSLFVCDSLRNSGVGNSMVSQALTWMDQLGVHTKRVVVYAGNERAQRFYARFGFVPRQTVLELPSNPDSADASAECQR